MKLLLSGGSHRATLGGIGAIGYFVWSESTDGPQGDGTPRRRIDRWTEITDVVSVSGGSLLNATLAAHPSHTAAEAVTQLRDLRTRLLADGALPHRSSRRMLISAAAIGGLGTALWLIAAALGLIGPDVLGRSPWAVLIGLAVPPVVISIERRLVASYLHDVVERVTLADVALDQVRPQRRHIICASGLSSGLPYYFVISDTPFEPAYGAALTDGFTVAQAATASASLPGIGPVRAPHRYRREVLVDGGVSGGFGEQVNTTLQRRPEDTWRSDGDWFAVDAVRHLMSDGRLQHWMQSISMISLLGRWLKVSLEATYVNDLVDLGPGQYARVWSPNVLPPAKSARAASTFRDGTTAADATQASSDSPQRLRLGALQDEVADMGLMSLRPRSINLAIVVGFVSTLEVRRGLDPAVIEDGLTWLDEQLDANGQLLGVWRD